MATNERIIDLNASTGTLKVGDEFAVVGGPSEFVPASTITVGDIGGVKGYTRVRVGFGRGDLKVGGDEAIVGGLRPDSSYDDDTIAVGDFSNVTTYTRVV